MYMRVCICIYIYIHVFIPLCIDLFICIHMHRCSRIQIFASYKLYMYTFSSHFCVYICIYICTYAHAHVNFMLNKKQIRSDFIFAHASGRISCAKPLCFRSSFAKLKIRHQSSCSYHSRNHIKALRYASYVAAPQPESALSITPPTANSACPKLSIVD